VIRPEWGVLVLAAVVFTFGVSGAKIMIGTVELKGMALAAVVGIVISLVAYLFNSLGLLNEEIPAVKNSHSEGTKITSSH